MANMNHLFPTKRMSGNAQLIFLLIVVKYVAAHPLTNEKYDRSEENSFKENLNYNERLEADTILNLREETRLQRRSTVGGIMRLQVVPCKATKPNSRRRWCQPKCLLRQVGSGSYAESTLASMKARRRYIRFCNWILKQARGNEYKPSN